MKSSVKIDRADSATRKKTKQNNTQPVDQNIQNETTKFIEEIYDRTVGKLTETIQEVQSYLQEKLDDFRSEFKKSLKHQLQLLKQLADEELLENLQKLKEQIKSKHENLISFKEQLKIQVNPKFYIEAIFKLPQNEEPIIEENDDDDVIKPKKYRKNKYNNKCEYTCPKCSKKFWFRLDFGRHLSAAHNLIMKFKCPSCPFFEFDYMKLTPHLFEEHGVDSKDTVHNKIYICPITKQQFSLRPPLSYYVRDNINYRVYE